MPDELSSLNADWLGEHFANAGGSQPSRYRDGREAQNGDDSACLVADPPSSVLAACVEV